MWLCVNILQITMEFSQFQLHSLGVFTQYFTELIRAVPLGIVWGSKGPN